MNFTNAIKSGFRNCLDFRGRASRSEYWYWTLFVVLVSITFGVVDGNTGFRTANGYGISGLVFTAITLIPNISISVRRFHDRNMRGWWVLIGLIPIIGIPILWILFCFPGTAGGNRFGRDPNMAMDDHSAQK